MRADRGGRLRRGDGRVEERAKKQLVAHGSPEG
jgi:hypothetical protein